MNMHLEKQKTMTELELAKQRCKAVMDRIEQLPASTKITDSCKRTLLRLANSELAFLARCSSSSSSSTNCTELSTNIGHLQAVLHILHQPLITGVSRVCKLVPPTSSKCRTGSDSFVKNVRVDIVCTLNKKPVWIIVSDRNPRYITWDRCHKSKGLKLRIEEVLTAARSSSMLKPWSLILFFANGIGQNVKEKLENEFGASEVGLGFSFVDFDSYENIDCDWVNKIARSYWQSNVLEIKLDGTESAFVDSECNVKSSLVDPFLQNILEEKAENHLGDSFCTLISGLEPLSSSISIVSSGSGDCVVGGDLLNFDTTALIALVSGISNGGTKKLLATPESELRKRFKGNTEFVIGQAMCESQSPLHVELGKILHGKKGILCQSVYSEFHELVLMCGGPNERLRSQQLLNRLRIIPDCPSERMMALPTTRKLAMKNKIAFGTGDYWHAPTLTANMGFARAVSQTGMSLFIIEHRPRALTGD